MTTTAAPVLDARPVRLRIPWLAAGVGAVLGAVVLGVSIGAVSMPLDGVVRELLSHVPFLGVESSLPSQDATIVTELRLPRVVLALLVGAMLSMAGAAYQGVFRNPLADPYTLGAGAGAGLAVTIVVAATDTSLGSGGQLVPLAAFAGAIGGVTISYLIARRAGGIAIVTLVLAGVAVTSFLSAAQAFVLQRTSPDAFREIYSWILGRLTVARWHDVALVLPYVAVAAVVLLAYRRVLDVFAVGEAEAATLGVPVARDRLIIVAAASLATAAAVSVAGLIGFVGIVVPHAVRIVVGPSYRLILPLSILFGGAFLVLADLAGRTIISPAELPIGVITAFVGGPFFLLVLHRALRGRA